MWSFINGVSTALMDAWLWPLGWLSSFWQIVSLGLPGAVIGLLLWRWTSRPAALQKARDRLRAYLLELRLYPDDARVMIGAQLRSLRWVFAYFLQTLLPAAAMLVPLGLMVIQIESLYAYRGLAVGESAVLRVTLDEDGRPSERTITLALPAGLVEETPALRVDATREVLWRIRAEARGVHAVSLRIDGAPLLAEVEVGRAEGTTPWLHRSSDPWSLLEPRVSALAADAPAAELSVSYPRARGELLGLSSASWIMGLAALVFGLLLRRPLGVTF